MVPAGRRSSKTKEAMMGHPCCPAPCIAVFWQGILDSSLLRILLRNFKKLNQANVQRAGLTGNPHFCLRSVSICSSNNPIFFVGCRIIGRRCITNARREQLLGKERVKLAFLSEIKIKSGRRGMGHLPTLISARRGIFRRYEAGNENFHLYRSNASN